MATDEYSRLGKVQDIITGIQTTYQDAKKLNIEIRFEWQEPNDPDYGPELCPVININIER